MRIFVTGGCGFIGSNFILKQIKSHKNEIMNFDKLTYAGNINNLESISNDETYSFIEGDICDKDLLKKSIFNFKPHSIVHFAAESHVDRSIDSPINFIYTNVLGTAILLECSASYYKSTKISDFKFLHISTDEVYGSLGQDGLFTENTPYLPNSPYAASKASSDHLVRSWGNTYNLPIIITNCSNNYGPYQFPEKLIPLIIANCLDNKPLPVYGNGLNIRDWLYVEDHCEAINLILETASPGKKYNIGGNHEKSNIEIVKIICQLLDSYFPKNKGKYEDLIQFVDDRPGHDFRYAINSEKIKKDLGWHPNESFQTGIDKTIRWYLDNEEWWRKIQKNNYNQQRLGKIS